MKPDQHQGVPEGAPSSLPTYAELCAGYGGLGLAVEEVFGAKLAWYSEFDAAPSKIMAHHWPDAPNHGDMTRINWAKVMRVLILSGGTPCQDLSAAGRRAGMNEGTRSNLWVQMREAIAIQKPKWVVWENVRGAFSACASSEMGQCQGCVDGRGPHKPFLRALGRVLGDLSDLGYDCQWRGLRAADVGGCHPRFRVFVLGSLRDTISKDVEGQRPGGLQVPRLADESRERRSASADAAHAISEHRGQRRLAASSQTSSGEPSADDPGAAWRGSESEHLGTTAESASEPRERLGAIADAVRVRQREHSGESSAQEAGPGGCDQSANRDGVQSPTDWGPYGVGIRRWERTIGRAAPRPTEPTGRNGGQRLSPRFTEWMMGLPAAIGISRNEQLKACGNGVVPQQAIAALRDMLAAFEALEAA